MLKHKDEENIKRISVRQCVSTFNKSRNAEIEDPLPLQLQQVSAQSSGVLLRPTTIHRPQSTVYGHAEKEDGKLHVQMVSESRISIS